MARREHRPVHRGRSRGNLFGLAVSLDGSAVYYVNDGDNNLYVLS